VHVTYGGGSVLLWRRCDTLSAFGVMVSVLTLTLPLRHDVCLQCFDAVGWAAGRAFGL